jgi:hypothetical protein
MTKFWTKKAKRNVKIIAVVGVIVLVWGALTNWKFFSPAPTIPGSGDITMHVFDTEGNELEDAAIAVREVDATDLTTAEKNALKYTDLTAKSGSPYETGDDFTPEAEFIYVATVTLTSYQTAYKILTPGDNVIVMTYTATSVSMLCYSSPALNTTVTNATEVDWTILIQMRDVNGDANSTVGYNPLCDFSTATDYEHFGINNMYLLLNVTFNAPPTVESVNVDGYTASKAVFQNSTLICISCGILGSAALPLTFATDSVGVREPFVARTPTSISLRWGNSSVATQLAAQS